MPNPGLSPRALLTRRPLRRFAVAAATALLATLSAAAQPLERQVRAVIDSAKLGPVKLGVCIIDCTTGERLVTINERTPLTPASNLKVLTSGSALLALGSGFEFTTRFIKDGDRLVVVGDGDPAFADPELLKEMGISVGTFVDKLADAIRSAQTGTQAIREIVIDDRVFDRDATHPSWNPADLDRWYGAPVHGFNFHTNLLEVYVAAAARPGPSPAPRTEPSAAWIEVLGNAPTVKSGANTVGLLRDPAGDTRFRLSGTIVATPSEPISFPLKDAGLVFARLLADRLSSPGGPAIAVRNADPADAFATGPTITTVKTPIARVLKRCNTDSYNLYADALLKRAGRALTGQPGSWSNGAAVVRMQAADKLGPDAGELVIADGSGLSRDNKVTPLMLAQWLALLAKDPATAQPFADSLATPGEGTFRDRFRNHKRLTGQVAGKSGFIRGVQCLSGYVTHPTTNRKVAFAILVNNVGQGPGSAKEFHEDVVETIDKWLAKNAPTATNPGRMGG
jgi:D-alanyl-D-alanine carboxypeptidase/D-alanyl-D-alanine-endopeptidase (penicillin-binding protein 4)